MEANIGLKKKTQYAYLQWCLVCFGNKLERFTMIHQCQSLNTVKPCNN